MYLHVVYMNPLSLHPYDYYIYAPAHIHAFFIPKILHPMMFFSFSFPGIFAPSEKASKNKPPSSPSKAFSSTAAQDTFFSCPVVRRSRVSHHPSLLLPKKSHSPRNSGQIRALQADIDDTQTLTKAGRPTQVCSQESSSPVQSSSSILLLLAVCCRPFEANKSFILLRAFRLCSTF